MKDIPVYLIWIMCVCFVLGSMFLLTMFGGFILILVIIVAIISIANCQLLKKYAYVASWISLFSLIAVFIQLYFLAGGTYIIPTTTGCNIRFLGGLDEFLGNQCEYLSEGDTYTLPNELVPKFIVAPEGATVEVTITGEDTGRCKRRIHCVYQEGTREEISIKPIVSWCKLENATNETVCS